MSMILVLFHFESVSKHARNIIILFCRNVAIGSNESGLKKTKNKKLKNVEVENFITFPD